MKTMHMLAGMLLCINLLCSCNGNEVAVYVEKFPEISSDTIRFPDEIDTPAIKSPFDEKELYPFGKFTLHEDTVITLACHHDIIEPYGQVMAEYIIDGKRVDQVMIAMGDMDGSARSFIDFPEIEVEEEVAGDERGGYTMFTTYLVTPEGFKQIDYHDTSPFSK